MDHITAHIAKTLRRMKQEYPEAANVKWVALDSAGNILIQYKDKRIETYSKELSVGDIISSIIGNDNTNGQSEVSELSDVRYIQGTTSTSRRHDMSVAERIRKWFKRV